MEQANLTVQHGSSKEVRIQMPAAKRNRNTLPVTSEAISSVIITGYKITSRAAQSKGTKNDNKGAKPERAEVGLGLYVKMETKKPQRITQAKRKKERRDSHSSLPLYTIPCHSHAQPASPWHYSTSYPQGERCTNLPRTAQNRAPSGVDPQARSKLSRFA